MAYLAGTDLGYRTTVRGAGGTGFVAANPEYDIPPYLEQIRDGALDVRNPELVVIAGGSNDWGRPVGQVRKNARKILRIAAQKYPRALLVLVGPLDTYGGYDDSIPIRDALRGVARTAGRAVHRRHDLARRPPGVAVRRLRAPDVRRPGAARAAAREGAQEARRLIRARPYSQGVARLVRALAALAAALLLLVLAGCGAGGHGTPPGERGQPASRQPRRARRRPDAHGSVDPADADRARPRIGADHVAVLRRLLHRRGRLHRPEELHGRDRRPPARLAVPDPRWRRHRLRVRQPGLRHPEVPRADPRRRARRRRRSTGW